MSPAEERVKKLARLPSNTICANCGTSKKFGFSTVCIKFCTFVCNECKSSHQAISHRCKSLTMSSWTDAEVAELELKGNDYARRTWLKNAPPVGTNGRPKEGDHVDVFKRFVVDVYERSKYYGEDTGVAPQQVVVTALPITQAPTAVAPRRPVQASPPVPAPAPPPDLLSFATVPASSVAAPASGIFQANFDAFDATPAPAPVDWLPPNSGAAPAPVASGSAFGFISVPPTPAPTPDQSFVVAPSSVPASSGFSFLNMPPPAVAPSPMAAVNPDFADFAGLSISTPAPTPTSQTPVAKKPVMSHSGASQNASLISSMDSLSAPSATGGFRGAGGMAPGGFGMDGMNQSMGSMSHGMNNNNMSHQQRMMMMQQQQLMMQQQAMMGAGSAGMNMNSNMMGRGMNNNMMGATSGGAMGIGMMTPQQMMMMMSQQNNAVGPRSNTSNTMSSLSLTGMDMNAWTTGKK